MIIYNNGVKRIVGKRVGVAIVTHNDKEASYIVSCLSSLYKNSYTNFTCIAVDHASSDIITKKIRKKFPQVKVFKNKNDKGLAAAQNQTIRYFLSKKSDYILLLNPDTISKPSLIQEMIGVFEKNINAAVVGPIILYQNDPQKIWFAGGSYSQFFAITQHPFMNQSLTSVNLKTTTVDFITGACIMIRADIFKKVGFLPENYFLYFEDVFFCQKVRSLGYSCVLLAKPLIKHLVSGATGKMGTNTLTPIRAYYYARNPLIYIHSETYGMQKITNLFGQFFIRLPYYLYSMIKDKSFKAIPFYFKGLADGIFRKSS